MFIVFNFFIVMVVLVNFGMFVMMFVLVFFGVFLVMLVLVFFGMFVMMFMLVFFTRSPRASIKLISTRPFLGDAVRASLIHSSDSPPT